MQNKENWTQKIIEIDNTGKLRPKKESLNGGSYVPITIGCKIFNKIGQKYFKGKLLDLGCGFVPFYAWYKDYIEDNICVDWADTYHKNEFLDIIHDISKDLPFENETFDSILSSAVLEHIYDPQHVITECARVLKKDGYLTISSNFSYWEHEEPYDYLIHTQYFFKRIAKELNLEILEIEPCGDGLCVIADISAKIHFEHPENLCFKFLYHLTKFLFKKWYLKGKRFLINQPLGYVVIMKK